MGRNNVNKFGKVFLFSCLMLYVWSGCMWNISDTELDSPPIGVVVQTEAPPTHAKIENHERSSNLRGAWVQATSTTTPEKVDLMLARAEAGHLNAVFVNVFVYGHAYYNSALLEKDPELAPDFDPLGYTIEQAHQRGIAVHAWLVAGPVGYHGAPGPILDEHPDWAMVGSEDQKRFWLNYTRPDVRQFIIDLALEIVNNYDVNGLHFDYTRYPGPGWGFDPYSAELFAKEYGADLDLLRYPELPAYALFKGNVLTKPSTAQVVATFDDGTPAVTINNYGAGETILLNWSAEERVVAVSSQILDRSIAYLLGDSGQVGILNSEMNATHYGYGLLENGVAWLEELGWQPLEITETELATLEANDVLVVPNVYLINAQVASELADFVRRGGGLVFIDGPTPSIGDKNLQALIGMQQRGSYFKKASLLLSAKEHSIVPSSTWGFTLEEHKTLHNQWNSFREQGLNMLLQEIHRNIKPAHPEVLLTITVSSDQEMLAEEHLLDWQAWIEGQYVDLVIPRAYVEPNEALLPVIANWQSVMESSDRIALGLSVYQEDNNLPKTPERMLGEIALARENGSEGILLFDLEHIGDDVLTALAEYMSP
ncbi:MAG: family 10 glycosylhydrolase [Anaerolineales bacterium]|nr:family 10 glycosylhydrolase [Anaerolineales bacterium]